MPKTLLVPSLSILATLLLLGCPPADCPDGFLRDNDGNCLQVDDDDAGDDDDATGDLDGDGHLASAGDCDDANPTIYPGAPEVADDGIDQDCNGYDTVTCFEDLDGDTWGTPSTVLAADGDCDDIGESSLSTDCDDAAPAIFPGADETCDEVDSDCDGDLVDEFDDLDDDGEPDCIDADVDGDGDPGTSDCDDEDPAVHADAAEDCDAIDSDCDGDLVDEFDDTDADGEPDCTDLDDDGDGDPDDTDCAETDPDVYTGAPETADDGIDQDCNGFDTVECFVDGDGDSFGGTATLLADDGDCDDAGESGLDTDCDDGDPTSLPGATELCDGLDNDCDTVVPANEADADADSFRLCQDDCDDAEPTIYPGAPETCDEVDSDCDTSLVDEFDDTDGDLDPDCTDTDDDGDGDPDATDCDDTDATVFTGAAETVGDGIDQDCNGFDTVECFEDGDGDGYGVASLLAEDGDCTDTGEATDGGDCDDVDPTVNPGASESCDAIDSDCDGSLVDEFDDTDGDLEPDCTDPDDDGDGDPDSTDCDDGDATVYTGAPEACDGVDSDCDGDLVDEFDDTDSDTDPDCTDPDDDADGDPDVTDCDDTDPTIFSSAPETTGDGIDQDCNGFDTIECFTDGDGDGYGTPATQLADDGDCADPGESALDTDCDDIEPTTFPGAAELCDGADNDCDTVVPADESDVDADGFRVCESDCDDTDPSIHPGAAESCDTTDSDCDGSLVDEFDDFDGDLDPDCTDPDDDGDGDPDLTDCADDDPSIYTGAPEAPDDWIDQDCDGFDSTECFEDWDIDGYGDPLVLVFSVDDDCDDPGESATGDDCDDTDSTISPNAVESCDTIDSDCDGDLVDEFDDTDLNGDPNCTDPDDDGDGDPDATDCDDTDATVFTGAPEVPDDSVDQDCDGFDGTECYEDWDGDGFGDPAVLLFSVDDDCDDAGESANADDCNDVDPTISPAETEMDLVLCLDNVDQDCDGLVDTDDVSCACSVQRAMVASQTFPCPGWLPVSGVAGAFDVSTATLEFVDDPDTAWEGAACTQPLLLRTDTDIRGLTVGIDPSGLGVNAVPSWTGSSMTATSQSWQPGIPENCMPSAGASSCAFPGTPSTAPGVECYAVSFWTPDSAAAQTVELFASIDRTTAGADRLDMHAVIAGTTPITEDQITDTLSYAGQAFETQGLSLGVVSFETISQYAVFDLDTELPDVAAAPTGAGATARAVTVIFVDDISCGANCDVIGISSGLPGLLGTSGTAGSAVVVAVSTFMDSPTPNLEGLGLDVAHEIGHYLGLNHTTQIDWNPTYGWLHDFLADTAECSNGGPDDKISPAECWGQGAENVMFPILVGSLDGISFTAQQGDVLASTAPGPLTTCVDSLDCFDDEVCELGECERAWARPYTLYIDYLDVATSGPSGNWDSGLPAYVPPDPYLDWCFLWGLDSADSACGVTTPIQDTYQPVWNESADVFALKSESWAFFDAYDEDSVFDDQIDLHGALAPLPIDWLRSPYLALPGDYSTLNIGFEPQ